MFMFYQYYYILIPAILFTMYAQSRVASTFNKYSRVANSKGMTGAEAAERILSIAGINDVRIERIAGNLTDHYDPAHKVLRLSDTVYGSSSIAAVGVAAHETGHAIQHDTGYFFLKLRSGLVPLTNISSKMSMPLIFAGILFGFSNGSAWGNTLVQVGIVLFSMAVVFAIVTLPVEINASVRAIAVLDDNGILSHDEIEPAKKVLKAAAMTYVAAAASAILSLVRLLLIFGRRRD